MLVQKKSYDFPKTILILTAPFRIKGITGTHTHVRQTDIFLVSVMNYYRGLLVNYNLSLPSVEDEIITILTGKIQS